MKIAATLDPSVLVTLYHRVSRNGAITLIFKDTEGEPYDISAIDFSLLVKRWQDSDENVFELTLGDGLTVQGEDTNELLIEIGAERSTVPPSTYFWELVNNTGVKTWLNGDLIMHNGKFDAFQNASVDVAINPDGQTIEVTINDSGTLTNIDGGNAQS